MTSIGVMDAEKYLRAMGDNMPLYTNTREGIFIQGPSPVESSSDVHRPEYNLREHLANRMSKKQGGPETPINGKHREHSPPGEASDDDMRSTCFIDGLQEEIHVEGLQDTDDELDSSTGESRARSPATSRELSPLLRAGGGDLVTALSTPDARRKPVSPSVIQGLIQMVSASATDQRAKAMVALCNLCCESESNRNTATTAGLLGVLVGLLRARDSGAHTHRLATACLCNLAADPPLKGAIAESGAIEELSGHLAPPVESPDTLATAAHAAAALWSLCVDMEAVKTRIGRQPILTALLRQLQSAEPFVRGQACGCVGEVCIGRKEIKGLLAELGAVPVLLRILADPEPATQRLAASALCNLLANHEGNKRLAREADMLRSFAVLLKTTRDEAVRSAAAGGLYNLVTPGDRALLEELGVVDLMRQVPISRNIASRLQIPK